MRQKLERKNIAYKELLYQICKEFISERILKPTAYITPNILKNIIIVGSELGHFDEVRHLTEQYKPRIEENCREDVYFLCLGIIDYFEHRFDDAMDHLNSIKSTKSIYIIEAQSILSKIYYHKNETLSFGHLMESFRKRINKSNILTLTKKTAYVNYISTIKMMFNYKTDPNYKKSYQDVYEHYMSYKLIASQEWLEQELRLLNGLKQ